MGDSPITSSETSCRALLELDLYKNIKRLTSGLEVRHCTYKQWKQAILEGYRIYRIIRNNEGGIVDINLLKRKIYFRGSCSD